MLKLENKQINSIFERIVKDKNGILVRIRFTIIEIEGKFQGHIISVTPLSVSDENTEKDIKENIIYLPKIKISQIFSIDTYTSLNSIISPYLSLEFLMSQPTRAPSNR
jgi:hypothetical protein